MTSYEDQYFRKSVETFKNYLERLPFDWLDKYDRDVRNLILGFLEAIRHDDQEEAAGKLVMLKAMNREEKAVVKR